MVAIPDPLFWGVIGAFGTPLGVLVWQAIIDHTQLQEESTEQSIDAMEES